MEADADAAQAAQDANTLAADTLLWVVAEADALPVLADTAQAADVVPAVAVKLTLITLQNIFNKINMFSYLLDFSCIRANKS
jgi:hypothetical protein